ncbi:hypothetical protein ES708_20255 [subsurface metagenome]
MKSLEYWAGRKGVQKGYDARSLMLRSKAVG